MYRSRIVPFFLLPLVVLCASATDRPIKEDVINSTTRVCPESCVCFGGIRAVCKSTYSEDMPIPEGIVTLELDGLTTEEMRDYLKNAYHVKHLILKGIDNSDKSTPTEPTFLTSLDNLRSMFVKPESSNHEYEMNALERVFIVFPQLRYVYLDTDAINCGCFSVKFISKFTNIISNPFKIIHVGKCIGKHPELLRHSFYELKQLCASQEQHNDVILPAANEVIYSSALRSNVDDWTMDDNEGKTTSIEYTITDLDHRKKRDISLDDIDSDLDNRNQKIKSAIKRRDSGESTVKRSMRKKGKQKGRNGGQGDSNNDKKMEIYLKEEKSGKAKAAKAKNEKKKRSKAKLSSTVEGKNKVTKKNIRKPKKEKKSKSVLKDVTHDTSSGSSQETAQEKEIQTVVAGPTGETIQSDLAVDTPKEAALNTKLGKSNKIEKKGKRKHKGGKKKEKNNGETPTKERKSNKKNKEKKAKTTQPASIFTLEEPVAEGILDETSAAEQDEGTTQSESMTTTATKELDDERKGMKKQGKSGKKGKGVKLNKKTEQGRKKTDNQKKTDNVSKNTKKGKARSKPNKQKKTKERNQKKNKVMENENLSSSMTSDIGDESNLLKVPEQSDNLLDNVNVGSTEIQESEMLPEEEDEIETTVMDESDNDEERDKILPTEGMTADAQSEVEENADETPSKKTRNRKNRKKTDNAKKGKVGKEENKQKKKKRKQKKRKPKENENLIISMTSDLGDESNLLEVPEQSDNLLDNVNVGSTEIQESEMLPEEDDEIETTLMDESDNDEQTDKILPTEGMTADVQSEEVEENANETPSKKKKNRKNQKKTNNVGLKKNAKKGKVEKEENKQKTKERKQKKKKLKKNENLSSSMTSDLGDESNLLEVPEQSDNLLDNVNVGSTGIQESEMLPEEDDEIETTLMDESDNDEQTDKILPTEGMTADAQSEVEENANETLSKKKKNRKNRKKTDNAKKGKVGKEENKQKKKKRKQKKKKPKENENLSISMTSDLGDESNLLEVPEQSENLLDSVHVGSTEIQESEMLPEEDDEIETTLMDESTTEGKPIPEVDTSELPVTENIQDIESMQQSSVVEVGGASNGDTSSLEDQNDMTDVSEVVSETLAAVENEDQPSIADEDQVVDMSDVNEVNSEALTPVENEDEFPTADEDQVVISKEMFDKMKEILSSSKIDLPVDINDPYDLGLLLRHLRHHSDLLANIENPAVKQRVLDALNEQPEGSNQD